MNMQVDKLDARRLADVVRMAPASEEAAILIEVFEALKGPMRTELRHGLWRWNEGGQAFWRMIRANAFESAALTLLPAGFVFELHPTVATVKCSKTSPSTFDGFNSDTRSLCLAEAILRAIASGES
jgi:hypothetical protein